MRAFGVAGSLLNLIKKIVLIQWLWEVFAGHYLVVITFWIPALLNSILVQVLGATLDLIIGLSLLMEGFSRALELRHDSPIPPFKTGQGGFWCCTTHWLPSDLCHAKRKIGASLASRHGHYIPDWGDNSLIRYMEYWRKGELLK
jgi:hypothetical protein